MTSLKLKTLLATIALAAGGMASAQEQLLNVSYDVAREFYKDYNQAFVAHYKKTTGKDIKIDQAHGGSSAQARAVNDGLPADVVTFNTTTDIEFLASNGVVAKDWAKQFPHDASPTTSTMLFLVRNGNPKNIKDWKDLTRPDVKVVVVNPKTGGNGRYAYLAAWGSVREAGGTDAQAQEFVKQLYKNVPVLGKGGRDATSIFLQRNIGDVLITFESEVISVDREFGKGRWMRCTPRPPSWRRTPWRWCSARRRRRARERWPRRIWTTCTRKKRRKLLPATHCAHVRKRCSKSTPTCSSHSSNSRWPSISAR